MIITFALVLGSALAGATAQIIPFSGCARAVTPAESADQRAERIFADLKRALDEGAEAGTFLAGVFNPTEYAARFLRVKPPSLDPRRGLSVRAARLNLINVRTLQSQMDVEFAVFLGLDRRVRAAAGTTEAVRERLDLVESMLRHFQHVIGQSLETSREMLTAVEELAKIDEP